MAQAGDVNVAITADTHQFTVELERAIKVVERFRDAWLSLPAELRAQITDGTLEKKLTAWQGGITE